MIQTIAELSALVIFTGIALMGASFMVRGRVLAEGVRPGDADLYAMSGGAIAMVGLVLVFLLEVTGMKG